MFLSSWKIQKSIIIFRRKTLLFKLNLVLNYINRVIEQAVIDMQNDLIKIRQVGIYLVIMVCCSLIFFFFSKNYILILCIRDNNFSFVGLSLNCLLKISLMPR